MFYFKNKVILITGAANGLGKALAIEFYKQGANLALCDIDRIGLETIKSDLELPNQPISIHVTNISKEDEVILAKNEILNEHKKVDILINNAGVSISQAFDQMTIEDFKWLFDINFWGTVYFTKHFLSILNVQNNSKIVNVISMFANMGFPGKSAYSSSKAAIQAFTNTLNAELTDTNVKLSFVIPPAIHTGIVLNGKHINEEKKLLESLFLKKNGLPVHWVAQKIISQIKRNKYKIVIGAKTASIDWVARIFPAILNKIIIRNKKKFDFI